jgi:porin
LGNPVQHVAHGVYASVESPLAADGDREFTGFLRIGLADGDTTDFHGGWQAGVRVAHVFASRPDSVFAVGINQGVVSSKFRANQRDIGVDPATAESALELTYSDRISEHFTLQPDLQIIHHPGADRERDNVVVAGLRVIAEF